MLSIKTQTNLGNAKNYFRDHLNSGDYYSSKSATPGTWHGEGAKMLGLEGKVSEDDFLKLCQGLKPDGSKLTQRQNTVREGDKANKRIFFDFTFAPPKSVSIAALVMGDDRIKLAHERAIAIAGKELENLAAVRVRSKHDPMNGKDRPTGNLVMSAFTHESSRAVEAGAIPDPLLHTHLLCFNASKDGDEWKALQTYNMMKAQAYVSSLYDHELCRELKKMGYSIREEGKGWELEHISNETCAKFSKRRKAILEKTKELEKGGAKSGHEKLKDMAAHDGRIRKQGPQDAEGLRAAWQEQMTEAELSKVPSKPKGKAGNETPSEAVAWTERHLFERNAVVTEKEFLSACLKFSRGGDYSLSELKRAFKVKKSLLHEIDSDRLTTKAALATEKFILNTVKNGKGKYSAFAPGLLESAASLNALQRQAAEKLLASKDFCSVFRGGAGTGKTYTLQHLQNALLANGKQVIVLAPQNQQVAGLINDGFEAQTVSMFLANQIPMNKNTVVIVDEAGQIGGQDMEKLMSKIKNGGARTILSGDTRQHGAVARTDSLMAIERYANPHSAELAGELAIQRQQVDEYKAAVAAAESGDTQLAWQLLEECGSIVDTTLEDRTADSARLYVTKMGLSEKYDKATGVGGSVLMLSQTNVEVDKLNYSIRQELAKVGKLDMGKSFNREVLKQLDMTDAKKERAQYYPKDAVILLNRKIGNCKAGSVGSFVREADNGSIIINVEGNEQKVTQAELANLTVCEKDIINLTAGDRIQLKANVRISDSNKLANGQIVEVVKEDEDGLLIVKDAYGKKFKLPDDFKMMKHGYAVSSYGSQGKTIDHILISDSMCKAATSTREFYVSISRGKWSCTILTADREALQEHIQNLGDRALASDLHLDKNNLGIMGKPKPKKASRPMVPEVEPLGMRETRLNTSNLDKLREFESLGLNLIGQTSLDLPEPAADAFTVVSYKAAQVPANTLVEDTSLDIEGEQVGTSIKWMLKNLDQYAGKKATFRVVLGHVSEHGTVQHYVGEVSGTIVKPRGKAGFGFDACFQPEGSVKTLAELKPHHWNARALAVEKFNHFMPDKETHPIKEWLGAWQPEQDIEKLEDLTAHLGKADPKKRHPVIDISNGKKVELFGDKEGNWVVRGFAELQNVCIRGVGMLRGLLENEKVKEPENARVLINELGKAMETEKVGEIEHER